MTTTIDYTEAGKFSHSMEEWWDENGKFKTLHQINPLRLRYIYDNIARHYSRNLQPFKGLRVLDIGCGGGLLSEPVARMGAEVTAIDVNQSNIHGAQKHAALENIKINYLCSTIEELKTDAFDVILCLEVVEHVQNLPFFVRSCTKLLKKNGLIFFSTIHRTFKSYALAIIGAEYILRWVPVGTHDWQKFIQPAELEEHLRDAGLEWCDATGMVFKPLQTPRWQLVQDDLSVNYLCCATLS